MIPRLASTIRFVIHAKSSCSANVISGNDDLRLSRRTTMILVMTLIGLEELLPRPPPSQ